MSNLLIPQQGGQRALYECPYEDILYAGARGTGKTHAGLQKWYKHLIDNAREGNAEHCQGIVLKKTSGETIQLRELGNKMFPHAKKTQSPAFLRWSCGANFRFFYLRSDKDIDKVLSMEYSFIWVDEAGAHNTPAIPDALYPTMRRPVKMDMTFLLTANPGGAGHGWLMDRYPVFNPMVPNDKGRIFIPGLPNENRALLDAQPDYYDKVARGTEGNEALQKAWLYGRFDVISGAFFGDLFSTDKHVIKGLDPKKIPYDWELYRSYDFGTRRPFHIGFYAETTDTPIELQDENGQFYHRRFPPGTLIMVREIYNGKPGGVNEGYAIEELERIRMVRDMEKRVFGREFNAGPADLPAPSNLDSHDHKEYWSNEGVEWKVIKKGTRVGGWGLFRDRLSNTKYGEQKPGFLLTEECKDSIKLIPRTVASPTNFEDVDSDTEDHAQDSMRYMIEFRQSSAFIL